VAGGVSARLDTGTGPTRRRLTLAEAQRGDCPTPYTAAEWAALHAATLRFPGPTLWAAVLDVVAEAGR
jgi:hypothetical protein